jgi:hypothetical protein
MARLVELQIAFICLAILGARPATADCSTYDLECIETTGPGDWQVPEAPIATEPPVLFPKPPMASESPVLLPEPPSTPDNSQTGDAGATLPNIEEGIGSADLRASRSFFGPHYFPPYEFAAYGIVAFPSGATSATRERYIAICEAYVSTLPRSGDLSVPLEEQMVTVWPVGTTDLAAKLQSVEGLTVCNDAVDRYSITTALLAIKDARDEGGRFSGKKGPFLLAWAPSSSKGKPDVLVLTADMSSAETPAEILDRFQRWRRDIESNPALWQSGWDMAKMTTLIREWADKYGSAILELF